MAVSEAFDVSLRAATRRAYEVGRIEGAFARAAGAAALATPALLVCHPATWAVCCLGGLALVVFAGRVRGEDFGDGSRAGAIAGTVPCLLPVAMRAIHPDLCLLLTTRGIGPWICGAAGVAAGAILGFRSRSNHGVPFWASALAALGFAGAIGCVSAGAMGFAGLAVGVVAGGVPVLAARRAQV